MLIRSLHAVFVHYAFANTHPVHRETNQAARDTDRPNTAPDTVFVSFLDKVLIYWSIGILNSAH